MRSVQDLLFILCIVLSYVTRAAGLIHVFGYVGRDVDVSCSYGQGYKSHEKYLCKNDCGSSDVLITTSETKKNKFSIYDDKEKQTFTVTLSDLQSVDAGKYWCGVTRTGKDIYTEVKLELEQDTCCDKVDKIQSHERDSVSIICPYELEYQNNLKFICRGNQPSTCLQQAVITSDSKQNGRFTLTEDKESRRFTVNINKRTQEDSGWYLCGVHRNTGLDVFSAVELEVKVWCCVKTLAMSGTVTRPVTLQCPYPPHHQNNRKFLCKGDHRNNCTDVLSNGSRFTLQDDVSLSSFSVMITNLEAGDAAMRSSLCETGVGITRHCEAAGEPKGSEEIYANEETVGFSKQTTSKLQDACNVYSDADDDQPDYENFTATEEIYCNENFHVSNRKCGAFETCCSFSAKYRLHVVFLFIVVLSYVTRAAGVFHVFGYVGRDVNVSCSYGQGYESHEKYLCKNDCGDSDVLITTSETNQNKYSIYDDKEKRSFTVTISDLQSVDAGKYWCGVTRTGKDIYTEVKLKLEQDHCCNNVDKIQSHERDSVSIICPYQLEYQNNLKFICRGNQPSTCLQQAVITSDSKQNGRFTLTEDKESRRFTVNINNLTQEDSGWYLCGVHRNTGLDVFSAVELEVEGLMPQLHLILLQ
ncbi:polymeric immunoglobulin receptor-like [Mugil cephalus]|uniref:polymeric immunoglobulin receptor-like n=1 Tax=Mugil cephalus TaxID=48193 RepID=UPI001FB6BD47|nr:polymeric immunoglobulin receptor-like [Mugil cephalus]